MALSSGRTGAGKFQERFERASIRDVTIGAQYQVRRSGGTEPVPHVSYTRPSTGVSGTRALEWFIGSGVVGRSYGSLVDGFLFQAPVSYFSAASEWNLSPGYQGKPNIDVARPIEPGCLNCHASRVQHVASTQNRYREAPFLEGGIGCERCHGPGSDHVAAMRMGKRSGATLIVNPVRLEAKRRDSVCQQCHLTGAARVEKVGKSLLAFRAGERLSDYLAVFVWERGPSERAATDHGEQLSRSACGKASGSRLWCGSCHDPHSEPTASEKVAFYRKGCLQCHQQQDCTEKAAQREARGDDCAACHLPKGRSREGEHVVYTDHTIWKRPPGGTAGAGNAPRALASYWTGQPPDARDLALAYASLAVSDASLRGKALGLLQQAEPLAGRDPALLAQLAQFYDNLDKPSEAAALYERVLALDPQHAAAANFGIYRMQQGRPAEAMALWEGVFSRYPALAGPGINLAVAQWQAGERTKAETTLLRVLRFHPDLETARKLLLQFRATSQELRP
jgi:hypothetical protein